MLIHSEWINIQREDLLSHVYSQHNWMFLLLHELEVLQEVNKYGYSFKSEALT